MYQIPGAYSRTDHYLRTGCSARYGSRTRPSPPTGSPAGLNDVVVRLLLTRRRRPPGRARTHGYGHPANDKIRHAVDELDQAIRDIPDTVFDRPAGGQPPPGTSASTT